MHVGCMLDACWMCVGCVLDVGVRLAPPTKRTRKSILVFVAVVSFVQRLKLSHVADAFRVNGVDGQLRHELAQAEVVSELGLTSLQARKLKSRLV